MTQLAPKPYSIDDEVRGKLVLFIGKEPNGADLQAKAALLDFDPSLKIVEVGRGPYDDPTPWLNAIEADRSVYRGLEAILGFIGQQRIWERRRSTDHRRYILG